MRYKIYILLAFLCLAAAGWYLYDYLSWRSDYTSDQSSPGLWPHVLILTPGLMMVLAAMRRRSVSSIAFYGSIVCTALMMAGIAIGLTYEDAVGGGLTMLLLAFPGAIVLTILALMELVQKPEL